ncbi:MAG: (Fe-S)-binding protein, partial [Rhodospirillales bacterium]|nr:(Fe-S)-binding protein [Rhodospirillales bacterium]
METRELFWEITSLGHTLFFVVAGLAMAVAAAGVVWHVYRYARARRSPVPVHPWRGFWRMVFDVFSQRTVHRRDRPAGHAHTPIMYGFLLLLAATSIITVEYDISEPFFGFTFWHGDFYLAFSLIADLAGLGLIVGVVYMMWRRWQVRPPKLAYQRSYRGESETRPDARAWEWDDTLFLWALLLIGVTGFLQEGVRLAMDQPPWGAWSPVGWVLAQIFLGLGMDEAAAAAVRRANWWIHGIAALAFIAGIPWTKAKHIIAVLGSLSTRDSLALRRLPKPAPPRGAVADDAEPEVGFGSIGQFSWKDLLNLDACTKCGRCHEACPATASGAPLSPRDLILDLRSHAARSAFKPGTNGAALIGDVIEAETLWSCRSCGACMEICPVGIEHPPMIVQMRRQLVEDGAMEQQLRDTLDMIANRGNSFGESARSRGGWTAALEFPVKDIRAEPAENLWFVGDYASYDPRNQDVSRTVARLFRAAGLDFGLLYESERTA